MKLYFGNKSDRPGWQKAVEWIENQYAFEKASDVNEKGTSDFIVYIITAEMDDISAIIDAVNDSNVYSSKTLFCLLTAAVNGSEFTSHQEKSLVATGKLIARNGGEWFNSLEELAVFIFRQ